LVAPFAGTVTAVHVAVGEYATGLAVELVDTDSLRVVLDVDEVDIGTIRVGQPTIISLETWPQYDLPGEVVSIAPKAKSVGGIVAYEVQLSFDPRELPVLTGMTTRSPRQKSQLVCETTRTPRSPADSFEENRSTSGR
jgi:HlyD family secretion protein